MNPQAPLPVVQTYPPQQYQNTSDQPQMPASLMSPIQQQFAMAPQQPAQLPMPQQQQQQKRTRRSNKKIKAQKYCVVCGDRAIACNFNATTCESCKAFFRRNAFKVNLKCVFDDQCVIDRVTRRFCSSCRLKKCFNNGMLKEWILSDEQKQLKRDKINDNKRLRSQISSNSSGIEESDSYDTAISDTATNTSASSNSNTSTIADELDTSGNNIIKLEQCIRVEKSLCNSINSISQQETKSGYNEEDMTSITTTTTTTTTTAIKHDPNNHFHNTKTYDRPISATTPPACLSLEDRLTNSVVSPCYSDCCRGDGSSSTTPLPIPFAQPTLNQIPYNNSIINHGDYNNNLNHNNAIGYNGNSNYASNPNNINGNCGSHDTTHGSFGQLSNSIQHHHQVTSSVSNNIEHNTAQFVDGHIHSVNSIRPPLSRVYNYHHQDGYSATDYLPNDSVYQRTTSNSVNVSYSSSTVMSLVNEQRDLSQSNSHMVDFDGSDDFGDDYPVIPPSMSRSPEEFYAPETSLNPIVICTDVSQLTGEWKEWEVVLLNQLSESSNILFKSIGEKFQVQTVKQMISQTDFLLARLVKCMKKLTSFNTLIADDQVQVLKARCLAVLLLRSANVFEAVNEAWNDADGNPNNKLALNWLKQEPRTHCLYDANRHFLMNFKEGLRYDRMIMILLAAILIFDTDNGMIKDRNALALRKARHIYLLMRYLHRNTDDPLATRHYLMSIVLGMQTTVDSYLEFMHRETPSREVYPLLCEFFDM